MIMAMNFKKNKKTNTVLKVNPVKLFNNVNKNKKIK